MRLIKMFGVAALAALLAVAVEGQGTSAPGSSKDSPKVAIESFTHDFGEVKPGTMLRYIFLVRNVGKADLVINNVAPS